MAEKPMRVQLSRARGWRMPPGTEKVARPSLFGNPYPVERYGLPLALTLYERSITGFWTASGIPDNLIDEAYAAFTAFRGRIIGHPSEVATALLRGKNLACWCRLCAAHKDGKPLDVECKECAPCHVDSLGRIANG